MIGKMPSQIVADCSCLDKLIPFVTGKLLSLILYSILDVPMDELKQDFDAHASESVKHPSRLARNFLEYCCFRTLALPSLIKGHLADKHFRRLTFDMMLAWESPAVPSESPNKVASLPRFHLMSPLLIGRCLSSPILDWSGYF